MSAKTVMSQSSSSNQLPINAVQRIRAILYSHIAPAEILRRLKINTAQVRKELKSEILDLISDENMVLTHSQKKLIVQRVLDDVLGFGPIEPLLKDRSINEIMINGPYMIFIERNGRLERTDQTFEDVEHLMNVIDKIIAPLGRRVDESSPMVDGRLPDGSRVNVIIPPVALSGPTLTIRRFRSTMFTFEDLVDNGTIPKPMIDYIPETIKQRRNILVTGGTGSGKTTLLNAISSLISPNERIVTIEDAAELRFTQPHVVSLESRPANIEGHGRVNIRELVINALRMRPDRIVIGEVRGGETLDMLQAMNTGHDGSLTTAHANSPHEALSRLETMALMSGLELPVTAVRQQIAGGFDYIMHMRRNSDGSRCLSEVVRVTGVEGSEIKLECIHRSEGNDVSRY
ncbi:MAG TPA: CpaF family protein [Actinobacteria bacterium]|nr:CpaF family protein [Actinomycetota bacterium]